MQFAISFTVKLTSSDGPSDQELNCKKSESATQNMVLVKNLIFTWILMSWIKIHFTKLWLQSVLVLVSLSCFSSVSIQNYFHGCRTATRYKVQGPDLFRVAILTRLIMNDRWLNYLFQLVSYSATLIEEKLTILKMTICQFHLVAKDWTTRQDLSTI